MQGPLPRPGYLVRRGAREQLQAQDVDLRIGVIEAVGAPVILRVQVRDDHSIPAVDGSAAALQAADHLELWTLAPSGTKHFPDDDDAENPRSGWLIGRDGAGDWHVAPHPGSQESPSGGVTVEKRGDELWIALPHGSLGQFDGWFTNEAPALAVVFVDVDVGGKPPEAVVSTGTLHRGRPAVTPLRPCESPGPYPSENDLVKIRGL